MRTEMPLWAELLLKEPLHGSDESPNEKRSPKRSSSAKESSRNRMTPQPGRWLILLAHGSKDPRWSGTFECLHASVRALYGEKVLLAYMEFAGPTLMDA